MTVTRLLIGAGGAAAIGLWFSSPKFFVLAIGLVVLALFVAMRDTHDQESR